MLMKLEETFKKKHSCLFLFAKVPAHSHNYYRYKTSTGPKITQA